MRSVLLLRRDRNDSCFYPLDSTSVSLTVIAVYFGNNPLKHSGPAHDAPVHQLVFARADLCVLMHGPLRLLIVAKGALGTLMSVSDPKIISAVGTWVYACKFSRQRAVDR